MIFRVRVRSGGAGGRSRCARGVPTPAGTGGRISMESSSAAVRFTAHPPHRPFLLSLRRTVCPHVEDCRESHRCADTNAGASPAGPPPAFGASSAARSCCRGSRWPGPAPGEGLGPGEGGGGGIPGAGHPRRRGAKAVGAGGRRDTYGAWI